MHYLTDGFRTKGIEHVVLNVEDSDEQDITHYFDSSVSLIAGNLVNGGVLVHCQYGVSRIPAFNAII